MDVDKGGPCRSLDNIAAAVNCAVMRGEEGRGGVNNCCQLCVCVCGSSKSSSILLQILSCLTQW